MVVVVVMVSLLSLLLSLHVSKTVAISSNSITIAGVVALECCQVVKRNSRLQRRPFVVRAQRFVCCSCVIISILKLCNSLQL